MPEAVIDELYRAVQSLMIAGVAAFAFHQAQKAATSQSRWKVTLKSVGWAFGVAIFAAASQGSPSCLESDPLRGGCYEYADDGYEVSADERYGTIAFWLTIILAPALVGAYNSRR